MRVRVNIHNSTKRWPRKRAQHWWFTIEMGTQVIATSETYTNRADAHTAARNLFGATEVTLHDPWEAAETVLRISVPRRPRKAP